MPADAVMDIGGVVAAPLPSRLTAFVSTGLSADVCGPEDLWPPALVANRPPAYASDVSAIELAKVGDVQEGARWRLAGDPERLVFAHTGCCRREHCGVISHWSV